MEFSSLSALANYVQTQINSVLKNEVAEYIINEAKGYADEVIYDAYEPKDYDRRFTYGTENGSGYDIVATDGVVEIHPNPIALADLIEHGNNGSTMGLHYDWDPPSDRDPTYLLPRPFVATTKENLEGEEIKDILSIGLNDRGIPTE